MEWFKLAIRTLAVTFLATSAILALAGHISFDNNKKLDRVILFITYSGMGVWALADAIDIAINMGGN
ncbi:MAG: hypothetical protein ACRCUK_13795 [Plesiomonas shigelloides]